MSSLKQVIQEKLFNKSEKLNGRKMNYVHINQPIVYKQIFNETEFLHENASIQERIYCILNDINDRLICKYCGSPRSFTKYRGYKKTCGKPSCSSKLRYSDINEKNKIGNTVKENNDKNKKLLLTILNDKLKLTSHQFQEPNFKKLFNINNVTNIINVFIKSSTLFPLKSKYDLNKIKKEYILRCWILSGNKLKPCQNCGKLHTNFDYRKKMLKNKCKSKLCFKKIINEKKLIELKHKLEPEIKPFEIIHIDNLLTKNSITLKCEHGHIFNRWLHDGRRKKIICPKCLPLGSSYENEIVDYLKSLGLNNILQNVKNVIPPFEIDIYLPDYNYAIEFNGDYWHSFSKLETNAEKMQHQNKYIECQKKGIKLIQIFEHEFNSKHDLIMNKIKYDLRIDTKKIMARKCKVEKIEIKEANDFFNQFHLQGKSTQLKECYGLKYNDELVSVIGFGKPRFNKKYDWEILRYASNKMIVGGLEKMFNRFKSDLNPSSIISYSDNRFGNGEIYSRLGFKKIGLTQPNYWYYKNEVFLKRYQTQKHKLKIILENFNNNLSESENMFNNGWRRSWDAGNTKWVLML